jgi:hypothetical protein
MTARLTWMEYLARRNVEQSIVSSGSNADPVDRFLRNARRACAVALRCPDEPDDWIAKARKFARPKVIAEGWTDADIDRIIKEERKAVQHRPI